MRQLVVNEVHRRNDAADRADSKIFNADPDSAVFKSFHRLGHSSPADLRTLAAVSQNALNNYKSTRPLQRTAVAPYGVKVYHLAVILESHPGQGVQQTSAAFIDVVFSFDVVPLNTLPQ